MDFLVIGLDGVFFLDDDFVVVFAIEDDRRGDLDGVYSFLEGGYYFDDEVCRYDDVV